MNSHNNPAETKRLLTEHSLRRALAAENRKVPQAADEIDHAAADPVLDRLPAYRSGRDGDRLTSILDSLERRDG